jgi:hypothetical protein
MICYIIEGVMSLTTKIKSLLEVFKVANDDLVGNVARKIFDLKWKEGLSARNQAHKILDELALTKQIQKGKGFYSVNYQGEYKSHDRLGTDCIARLILLGYPLTIRREASLPLGLRADVVGLIGKGNKATAFWLEICDTETDFFFSQKVAALRNNQDTVNQALTELFAVNIPSFMLLVFGKSHPEAMDFDRFLEEVKR